ncbi:hypothetical protein OEA41_003524 [Lepraria neglecta]|uniref:Uncharacterized protein n=1 Tax=Lepraria neglecta TaxID=209136 RepID=A0AAD9Z4G9_9LECA|nr:hypothetical protein OEA41_003524 [Lepraria neglecta]
MAASRRSPLMRDQWRAEDDYRDTHRRRDRDRGLSDRRQASPAAPQRQRDTDVGLKIKGRATVDSAPGSPSRNKKKVVRPQGEDLETRIESSVLATPVRNDVQIDLGTETNQISSLSGGELGADHLLERSLISGKTGGDLVARSIPVELTHSAQVADGVSDLFLLHAQAVGTTTHLRILSQEAWLVVSEIPTFREHEDAPVHLHTQTQNTHHITGALDRPIDTLSLGRRRLCIRGVPHPQTVHREEKRTLRQPKTVLHPALNFHQEGARK